MTISSSCMVCLDVLCYEEDKDTKCRHIITVLAPRCVPLGPGQGLMCEDDLRSFFDDVENVHRFNIEQNALGSDATERQTEYSRLAVRIGKAVTSRTGLSHSANIYPPVAFYDTNC
ncbi:uncharacterized protein UBRO_04208 [Ustilago bromivora]|uniref:Uncharacterized protein n=1 Tax=Ustilago bromivora TaxID=307758 RepID=A0A1K0G3E7_9BASI|nr:uncharacterized protein UBRO_04208 [Ustilago bromivora]